MNQERVSVGEEEEIIPTFGMPRAATSSPHHHRHVLSFDHRHHGRRQQTVWIQTRQVGWQNGGVYAAPSIRMYKTARISNTPYVSISVGQKGRRISADAAQENVSMECVNGEPNVSNLDLSKIDSCIYFLLHFNCLEIIYLNNASGICTLLRALRL